MADYSIIISETISISEHIDVLANSTRKIAVSDSILTSERLDMLRANARNITIADATNIFENVDVLRAGTRNVSVSEMSFTTEVLSFSILNNPSLINRIISLRFIIPADLPFIVTKKNV